ncbi:hypothetical protein BLNAU_20690 [Blattamonas nauphoetae]|uniref:Uncharacterized protein n=1 Tax=Blattamonas nauphoetae TaxID=2049346 RepID=A0ABQ9WYJ7_9EUKA|nr:hypothetical protein BLNAU_20690 [Blattamonas nauphoetae]
MILLQPHTRPFEENEDFHDSLIRLLACSIKFGTQFGMFVFTYFGVEESEDVIRHTFFDDVLVPSSLYMDHILRHIIRSQSPSRIESVCETIFHLFNIAVHHPPQCGFTKYLSELWDDAAVSSNFIKFSLILKPKRVSIAYLQCIYTDDIQNALIGIINGSIRPAMLIELTRLNLNERQEQQPLRTTVLNQALVPSENYLRWLFTNRFSIVDRKLSKRFVYLLTRLLMICPDHRPTLDFVLNLPIFLAFSSSLTFIENDVSISLYFDGMVYNEHEWVDIGARTRPLRAILHRSLRSDGYEDALEQRAIATDYGKYRMRTIGLSTGLLIIYGANIPERDY